MMLTLPPRSKYPPISLFTPKNGLSLSKVATHFKIYPHVLLKGVFCCCHFSVDNIPLRKFSLMIEGRQVNIIFALIWLLRISLFTHLFIYYFIKGKSKPFYWVITMHFVLCWTSTKQIMHITLFLFWGHDSLVEKTYKQIHIVKYQHSDK